MGTAAAQFWPHTTDWDGTDPASGDVRKVVTSLPALVTGSSCNFGTSGSKTITVDPYTAGRTTTGLDSSFGWAINIAGSDGMDGAADAKRFIPAGTWTFEGMLVASPSVSAAACTVDVHIYRVAASPSTTRTLLFSTSINAGTIPATGTGFSASSSSQPQYTLEAGETIQATYALTCTGQIGGLTIDLQTGDFPLQSTDTSITVPTPGVRTQYQETISTTVKVAATILDGVKVVTGVARDSGGDPVSGATLKLFDQSTDVKVSDYTTAADGAYQFTRADNDTETYWVVGFSDDTHHGTSDRGLTAQPE